MSLSDDRLNKIYQECIAMYEYWLSRGYSVRDAKKYAFNMLCGKYLIEHDLKLRLTAILDLIS